MSTTKWIASLLVIFTALVVQLVIVDGLQLPMGNPDLVAVAVICLALCTGPFQGLVLGFVAGLSVDFSGEHAAGRYALVLSLIGYAVGNLVDESERTALVPLLTVAVGSAVSVLGYALTGLFTGDGRLGAVNLIGLLAGRVIYDVVLTPFLYPLLRGLLNRLEPARL